MPSIKKRVTGFIRQLSTPVAFNPRGTPGEALRTRGEENAASKSPKLQQQQQHEEERNAGFVERYLSHGVVHAPGPDILCGKTGHDLPVLNAGHLDLEAFAAFTGPDGGLTSISAPASAALEAEEKENIVKEKDLAVEDSEDFDFIDLEHLDRNEATNGGQRRASRLEQQQQQQQSVIQARNGTSSRRPPKRECSVENDYPELGGDFPIRSNNSETSSTSASASQYANTVRVTRRLKLDLRHQSDASIAGVRHWYRPNNDATGKSVTLYERHPHTAEHAGNPIADTFAVVARKNSALLVLGDGVNWGAKAALASRCAVFGCIEYLNNALFTSNNRRLTTQEVFQCLLRSFHAAHSLILREEAQLTTLTACVVIPLFTGDDDDPDNGDEFVACVCNVGDSLAYVYNSEGHVREITQGSHDIRSNRDMRDALGALGPVDGINPELSNLTCSMTAVKPGDIVFLTSDGISDNFDPVVGKFCVPSRGPYFEGEQQQQQQQQQQPEKVPGSPAKRVSNKQSQQQQQAPVKTSLPVVEAIQRHELTLLRMEDLLNHGSSSSSSNEDGGRRVANAAELCHRMVDFCHRLTVAKRKILEDPNLYPEHTRHALPDSDAVRLDQKLRRRKVCEKLAAVPGKLDHATVVAFTVGDRRQSLKNFRGSTTSPVPQNETVAVDAAGAGAGAGPSTIRAPCASTEDLTCRDDDDEDEDETPTASASGSLRSSSASSLQCGSLAVTPVHRPRKSDGANGAAVVSEDDEFLHLAH